MIKGLWQRLDVAWAPAVIAGVLYGLFIFLRLANFGYDPSSFVVAGDRFVDRDLAPRTLRVFQESSGYDGQFYYRLALTPFTNKRTDVGITFDLPAYRQQRIMYPLLARLLSLGNPSLVPVALIAINYLALCLMGWLGGFHAKRLQLHALWGIGFPLFAGFLCTLSRDLTEALEAFWLFAAFMSIRADRHLVATLLLSLAVLTRETALIVIAAISLAYLDGMRRSVRTLRWYVFVGPVVVYLIWQGWVYNNWGEPSFRNAASIGPPMVAFFRFFKNVASLETHFQFVAFCELGAIIALTILILVAYRTTTARNYEKWAWMLHLILVFSLTKAVWVEDWGFLRILSGFYLLGMLILLGSSIVLRRLALTGAVGCWFLLAFDLLKMR